MAIMKLSAQALEARGVLNEGVAQHFPSKVFALLSGGDDSLTSTSIAEEHPLFRGVIHLDTGTGVPETRDFVEETCRARGWPLQVYSAPKGEYERLVLDGYRTRDGRLHQGFPSGPVSHATMYYHLKQKQIRQAIREHKSGPGDRVGFVAGIRIPESARRAKAKMAQLHYKEKDRAAVWLHPILHWTKPDCLDYLHAQRIPRNPVSINCHRSGECLCGALANNAELDEIAFFYPSVGERYARLAAEVRERGIADDQWAGGPTVSRQETARSASGARPQSFQLTLPLCTSCELRT
jgi:3'-phosphoadenosine 5'-phosphosulfate sulfotransferase (PAPS reductase)/FAD synthetase